jgi:hypothetical protein
MQAYARNARREDAPALRRFKLDPKYPHHRSDGTRRHAETHRRQVREVKRGER